MDHKDKFKKNLESLKSGVEVSSTPLNLFEDLSKQYETEIQNNISLNFKRNLKKNFKKIKENNCQLFDNVQNVKIENLDIKEDLIEKSILSISKENLQKTKITENYTNLFSQPDSNPDFSLQLLQNKVKFLENWITKISLTGPGGGAGQVYELDFPTRTVYSNTFISGTDYYIGVNSNTKTYITLPLIGENVYDGRKIVIKDESGHASLTPIKIVGTIDNDSNGAEIRSDNCSLQLIYNNKSWRII